MEIIPMLLKEMEEEAQTTRKMLERIPNDKFNWQPHEKSMTIKSLATHIAELPVWVALAVNTNELDFAKTPYEPEDINNTGELLALLERSLTEGRSELEKTNEAVLIEPWTLRNGEQVYSVRKKVEVIRMTYCQIVHHRAQLGVFLRLLNIPIPGSYGPSADEHPLK
ncbi:MAG: DinB family protein [Mucilaginibacter sp.]